MSVSCKTPFKISGYALIGLLLQGGLAHADNLPISTNIQGQIGLNTVPSARMDNAGTLRAGISALDPYAHAFLGLQLAAPLSITLRQSAELSALKEDPDRLYPGLDFKLRLLRENRARPAISIGITSAAGHKRMAGEYIALSKRYNDFDFTAGLGWGRYGTAGHFKNPFKSIHSHFGKNRALDGEIPSAPSDYFTGENVGLFGGVEYHTPIDGLSLKADYGADRYSAESAALDYNAPAPWAIGVNYQPASWIDIALAMQGTDKLMARLSFQGNVKNWRKENAQKSKTTPFRPYRTSLALPAEMELSAQKDSQILYSANASTVRAHGFLELQSGQSAPQSVGLAATHIANNAGSDIEEISITPTIRGLRGTTINLNRRTLEMAKAKDQGSNEEIWHSASFSGESGFTLPTAPRKEKPGYNTTTQPFFALDNHISLSEEDHGSLYRSSFQAGIKGLAKRGGKPLFFGLLDWGASVRINIKDNLTRVANLRPRAALPVRSNEDRFAARTIGLDTNFFSFTHSLRPDTHISLISGYVEEMYSGAGGEILYRPFKARWAIGAEGWIAAKRNPETAFNLGHTGQRALTGHVKGWYDIPSLDLTLKGEAGRYLANDFGGTLTLQKSFKSGAKLEGFVTVTDAADFDLFGGTTHAYNGVRLSLPLGGYKYAPDNAHINLTAAPFGRDTGQRIKNPLPLYELTEKFSYKHMDEYWDEIAHSNAPID